MNFYREKNLTILYGNVQKIKFQYIWTFTKYLKAESAPVMPFLLYKTYASVFE